MPRSALISSHHAGSIALSVAITSRQAMIDPCHAALILLHFRHLKTLTDLDANAFALSSVTSSLSCAGACLVPCCAALLCLCDSSSRSRARQNSRCASSGHLKPCIRDSLLLDSYGINAKPSALSGKRFRNWLDVQTLITLSSLPRLFFPNHFTYIHFTT